MASFWLVCLPIIKASFWDGHKGFRASTELGNGGQHGEYRIQIPGITG